MYNEIRLRYLNKLRPISNLEYKNFCEDVLFSRPKKEHLLIYEPTSWIFSTDKESVYFLFGRSGYSSTFGFLSYELNVRRDNYSFQRGGFFSSSFIHTPKGHIGIKNRHFEEVQTVINDFVEYHKQKERLERELERNNRSILEAKDKKAEISLSIKRNKLLDDAVKQIETSRNKLKDLKELDVSVLRDLLRTQARKIDSINPEYLQKMVRLKNHLENEIRTTTRIKNVWLKEKISLTWGIPCPDWEELSYFYAFVLKDKQTEEAKRTNEYYRKEFRQKYTTKHHKICHKITLDWVSVNDKPIVVPKKFSIEQVKTEYNFIVERYRHVNRLSVFGLIMINALLTDNKYLFYELYEKCDKLGVFQNNWENQVQLKLSSISDKLDVMNASIAQLIEVLREVEGNIVSELQVLEASLVSEINGLDDSVMRLDQNIHETLNDVSEELSYSNQLSTYNTYQLYKIRKKL